MTDKKSTPTTALWDDAMAAKVLARLIAHLQQRSDVQNIDLMNLAGFCRNCLAKWYQEEMEKNGKTITPAEAKKLVYGMDYDEWKKRHQREATPGQIAKLQETHRH